MFNATKVYINDSNRHIESFLTFPHDAENHLKWPRSEEMRAIPREPGTASREIPPWPWTRGMMRDPTESSTEPFNFWADCARSTPLIIHRGK
jgi:hypothetical protein